MSIKQISVFVENKPGALYALTAVLAQGQIDMRALSLAETKDFGIVRLIVDDLYKATTLLKDAGYVHSLTPWWGWPSRRARGPESGAPGAHRRPGQCGVYVRLPGR